MKPMRTMKATFLVAAAFTSFAGAAQAQEVFQPHPKTSIIAGLTTSAAVMQTATALSLGVTFSERQWLEGHVGMAGSGGVSIFGLAGQFKSTVWGEQRQGVHVGASLGLGSLAGSFFLTLGALGGLHFALPGMERFFIVFEGGPVLRVGTTTEFLVSPVSGALGFSIFYRI
jgi:hypothetical protein